MSPRTMQPKICPLRHFHGIMGCLQEDGVPSQWPPTRNQIQQKHAKNTDIYQIPLVISRSPLMLSLCVCMCVCVHNGHMIIHSHETIEELVSYYGSIRSQADPTAMLCVLVVSVQGNITQYISALTHSA